MTFGDIIERRRKCAVATREKMLCAARGRFLRESYENVGLRDIARDAGVDVALVSRYFGSKEELFTEVLRGEDAGTFDDENAAAADLPAFLASLVAEQDESTGREHMDKLLIILRSASSPAASEAVRKAFRHDVLEPLSRLVEGPGAETRASLILSILIGSTILGTIMRVEPFRDGQREAIRGRLEDLFRTVLAA